MDVYGLRSFEGRRALSMCGHAKIVSAIYVLRVSPQSIQLVLITRMSEAEYMTLSSELDADSPNDNGRSRGHAHGAGARELATGVRSYILHEYMKLYRSAKRSWHHGTGP